MDVTFLTNEDKTEMDSKKVSLPKDSDGTPMKGTAGQFAVSDGNGGISWMTVELASEVTF